MKEIFKELKKGFIYIKKHITKKQLILGTAGLGLILIGLLSWNIFFSRYYIFSKEIQN